MEIRDLQNAGSDILDAVSSAVATGNYTNLSNSIRQSVMTLTEEKTDTLSDTMRDAIRRGAEQAAAPARKQMTEAKQAAKSAPYAFNENLKGKSATWTRPESLRTYSKGTKGITITTDGITVSRTSGTEEPDTPYFSQGIKRFSPYAGAASMALSIIAAVACGGIAAILLVLGLIMSTAHLGAGPLIGAGLFAAGFVASLVFTYRGYQKHKLFDRYRSYGHALGDAEYIRIDDLVQLTGIGRETIIADIKECRKQGFLPETYFDTNETTLMVSRASYEQYLAAEKSRLIRENEQRALDDTLNGSIYSAQVKEILKDGEDYLNTVRDLNRRIPDEVMTEKISRIEDIMHKTFEEVKKQPGAAPSLRKYMSYYLPTTVKLLSAYADLDTRPEIGENITQTKKEICDSLDVVGDGFEKLFDSLFEEISWDISSDISVMKTMMAQDGLTETTMSASRPLQSAPVEEIM